MGNNIAHAEYSMQYHTDIYEKVTGSKTVQNNLLGKVYDACGLDFLWTTDDGLHGEWRNRGRCTDMGHAAYANDGHDQTEIKPCPFKNESEVWAFDPVTEYGLPDFQEQTKAYENLLIRRREMYPNQLSPGGYYKSIISGAIQAFGWDMLLLSAIDEKKFEKVLDGFFRFTLHHMNAWAATSAEVIIQHDDFVWSNGPFINPEFYRNVIIPRYAELWKVLKKAGKKVLFCSDGKYTLFMDDIVQAGADGLMFEPMNDFEPIVERYGASHCLVGSAVDCVDLTLGKWDKVKSDMLDTFRLAKKCKGLIFTVGNHIPSNVPAFIRDKYFDFFRANRVLSD